MKKRNFRKLSLSRETLRQLTDRDLRAAGGDRETVGQLTCNPCPESVQGYTCDPSVNGFSCDGTC
ncbi:MAG TPA: hypothetical protein VFE33_10580 [Thermoanaerobaculia bacterium]|nr:hypothetical protein [Thermoanaerobaculia bacterium]